MSCYDVGQHQIGRLNSISSKSQGIHHERSLGAMGFGDGAAIGACVAV
jgi:thiamine pyrophosphate-dependent acetolactate synthase large subunit-like protein